MWLLLLFDWLLLFGWLLWLVFSMCVRARQFIVLTVLSSLCMCVCLIVTDGSRQRSVRRGSRWLAADCGVAAGQRYPGRCVPQPRRCAAEPGTVRMYVCLLVNV